MGKKDKKPAAADTAADIDDIFAAPKKPSTVEKKPKSKGDKDKAKSSSSSSKAKDRSAAPKDKAEKSDKAEKKEKKRKADADEPPRKKAKERIVEEVVDPSLAVKAAVDKAKAPKPKDKSRRGKEVEEDMAFRDSRGDAGREYPLSSLWDLGYRRDSGGLHLATGSPSATVHAHCFVSPSSPAPTPLPSIPQSTPRCADTRKTHRRGLPRVQGGRARHRPRGGRHAAVPVRLRVL